MDEIIALSRDKIANIQTDFVRSAIDKIHWQGRLIGVKGPRGVGKTTLLLQYIKLNLSHELDKVLYTSLDHLWFNNHTLVGLAREFSQKGGKYLFLDEVHKYAGWAQELKNIYDDYPGLKVVFTGSSLLEILNARADLSRRAVTYHMQGLSFREFIAIEIGQNLPSVSLEEIISQHSDIEGEINSKIKPLQYFEKYQKIGYYPYYKEDEVLFPLRLSEVVNMMLDIELPLLRNIQISFVQKIKQLLGIIAQSVPFQPNVSKLAERTGINRNTLLSYLHYLDEVGLTINLFPPSEGISLLQKPSKIYLENSNMIFLMAKENANKGNLRETFFANQVGFEHQLSFTKKGDFLVDENLIFEVGGANKTARQIQGLPNAYLAKDDLTYGMGNTIPLWLFGFMY